MLGACRAPLLPRPDALRYAARWLAAAERASARNREAALAPMAGWRAMNRDRRARVARGRTGGGGRAPGSRRRGGQASSRRRRAVADRAACARGRRSRRRSPGRPSASASATGRCSVKRARHPADGTRPPAARRRRPSCCEGSLSAPARPDFAAFEAQLRSSGYCARPVRLRGTIEICDGARAPARVVDRRRARRGAAQGVREPPRGGLPAVRGALPPGRLPPDRRRPAGRQGRPGHDRRAPGGVRDADGAELRRRCTRARSGRTDSRGAAARAATRRSARTASALVRARCTPRATRAWASRCARSALTTRAAVDVEQHARRAVALHDDLPPARAGAPLAG